MLKNLRTVWNVPNVLTVLRILLVPATCVLMAQEKMTEALLCFLAAGLTDVIDGYIARHFNKITDLGKLLDPLADKLMIVCVMLMLVILHVAPIAAVAIILAKETAMIIGGILLLKREVVVYSRPIGKIAQASMMLSLVLCFFHQHFDSMSVKPHLVMLWISVVLSLAAFIFYYRNNFFHVFCQSDKKNSESI